MKKFLIACLMFATPSFATEVHEFELENGLQIVVLQDTRAPVVTHTVWYKVGAADEVSGKSGIAHFLEHLMFKGTDELEAGEFSETVTRNGGVDNAFTSWDYTAYFQRVASDRLGLMMKMEADRMRDLELSAEDVDTERQVILEERNQRIDNDPGALFHEQRRAAQFLNHPYGRPIIGWRHEMQGLTREDALAFYQAHYGPNNAILVVAGDVEPQEVLELAKTHYGPLAPNPNVTPRLRPIEPPQLSERRLEMRDARAAQPIFTRSYMAPVREVGDQKEAAALVMLAELLGGNMTTAHFARELAFENPKAVFVAAYYDASAMDPSGFTLMMVPAAGIDQKEAEAALDESLSRFLQTDINLGELERLKAQLRANQIYAQDNIASLSQTYGRELTVGLSLEDILAWPDVLDAVTPEDIKAAAERVFDRAQAVSGWLLPEGDAS